MQKGKTERRRAVAGGPFARIFAAVLPGIGRIFHPKVENMIAKRKGAISNALTAP